MKRKEVLKIIRGILLSLVLIIFTSFLWAIFNYSKMYMFFVTGLLCLFIAFILRKNKVLSISLILSCAIIISIDELIEEIKEYNIQERVVWDLPYDSYRTTFSVDNKGYIYFKARINDTTGLFLFDTGCELTAINERFITEEKMKLNPYQTIDASGLKQVKNGFKIKLFELGAIAVTSLNAYPLDSISWTNHNGTFYKQDNVFGIIGNNVISKFIWDFDLKSKQVTVSNKSTYCKTIPDSLAINLVSKNNYKEIPVQINGTDKMLMLDFGCSHPLFISDSISNKGKMEKKEIYSSRAISLLSHLDSTNERNYNYDYVDIKFGSHEYKQIQCFENTHKNLLGIPFIWSFERVVIDFINNKAYFISSNESLSDFNIKSYNRTSIENGKVVIEKESKLEGTSLIIKGDQIGVNILFLEDINTI